MINKLVSSSFNSLKNCLPCPICFLVLSCCWCEMQLEIPLGTYLVEGTCFPPFSGSSPLWISSIFLPILWVNYYNMISEQQTWTGTHSWISSACCCATWHVCVFVLQSLNHSHALFIHLLNLNLSFWQLRQYQDHVPGAGRWHSWFRKYGLPNQESCLDLQCVHTLWWTNPNG